MWLSKVGRLFLVNFVLEAIPVYWLFMAWSPKETLDKIRKLCFKFLWVGKNESFVMPWVKWDSVAMPKLLEGWGLKNIKFFCIALTTKVGWRLIQSDEFWSKVFTQGYISPDSVVEWIRSPTHSFQNRSIMWKALVKYFLVISQGLAWKARKGNSLRIGRDPWPENNGKHIIPQVLIDRFHEIGFFHLNQIANEQQTTIWIQGWKDA
jgi:hypothetical protein